MSKTSSTAHNSTIYCDHPDNASRTVGELNSNNALAKIARLSQDDLVNSTKNLSFMDSTTEDNQFDKEVLYSEILYEVQNQIGASPRVDNQTLCTYLQQAFHFDPEKHTSILQKTSKQKPKFSLHIEVLIAEGLYPKDSDGLSDPFCEVYVSSSPKCIQSTSRKEKTLNPVWNECLELSVENPETDILNFDVWDYDAPETVINAVSKIPGSKGFRGFGRALKEIANTLSINIDKELIGRAWIPLKKISPKGEKKTLILQERSGGSSRGKLTIKAAFMSTKNHKTAINEYKQFLRIFALHEIKLSEKDVEWEGVSSPEAELVIQQHIAHGGIDAEEEALANWMVYGSLSSTQNISSQLFQQHLKLLAPALSHNSLSKHQIQSFWDAARTITESSFRKLKEIRKTPPPEDNFNTLLTNTLSFLLGISVQLSIHDDKPLNDPLDFMEEHVSQAAFEWYDQITKKNEPAGNSIKCRLDQQVNIVKLLTEDLERAFNFHNDIFIAFAKFPYAKALCRIYDTKVKANIEQLVKEASDSLKPLKYDKNYQKESNGGGGTNSNEDKELSIDVGLSLFYLYLALKSFTNMQSSICQSDSSKLKAQQYYTWFQNCVVYWLDIAKHRAERYVERSLKLDDLQKPIDPYVKHSSSAVDSLQIYHEVKKTWEQIDWPDAKVSYSFLFKIINNHRLMCHSLENIGYVVEYRDIASVEARCMWLTTALIGSSPALIGSSPVLLYPTLEIPVPSATLIRIFESLLFMEFIYKIEDLCLCSEQYAVVLIEKLNDMVQAQAPKESKFCVTDSWCLAISNIDHVSQHMDTLLRSLGNNKVIDEMAQSKTKVDLEIAKESLNKYIDGAIQSISKKITYLLKEMVNKMNATLKTLITNVAQKQDSASFDLMMEYLSGNLQKLNSSLECCHLDEFLNFMVEYLITQMNDLYLSGLEKKKPETYFAHLHKVLQGLKMYFSDENPGRIARFSKILDPLERSLMLNGLDTMSLITQVRKSQMEHQKAMEKPIYGQLTVRAHIEGNSLHIEIMNGRNLIAKDKYGSSDPYVLIRLLPEDVFLNVQQLRTKTKAETLFPLFDESFTIPLTSEQIQFKDGMILFTVEDEDAKGLLKSDFMGEGYLMLSEVARTAEPKRSGVTQSHINLTKPVDSGCDAMKILTARQGDKKARKFIKMQKLKSES